VVVVVVVAVDVISLLYLLFDDEIKILFFTFNTKIIVSKMMISFLLFVIITRAELTPEEMDGLTNTFGKILKKIEDDRRGTAEAFAQIQQRIEKIDEGLNDLTIYVARNVRQSLRHPPIPVTTFASQIEEPEDNHVPSSATATFPPESPPASASDSPPSFQFAPPPPAPQPSSSTATFA
jgi:hypothetical protein